MYGKLFAQMYDGTLGTEGPWEALVTFQQMIVLADQDGTLDMTPEALSRRTTIPLEIIRKGIAALEQPDPCSRSPEEEGRRIVRLSKARDWGWRLVNHAKYRAIRSAEDRREYHRDYWHKRKASSTPATDSTGTQQTQPIAEAEAVTPPTPPRGDDHFETFWKAYPRKVGKDAALKAWRKLHPPADHVVKALSWQCESPDWRREGGKYIPNPATYLNQGRWKDEPPGDAAEKPRLAI